MAPHCYLFTIHFLLNCGFIVLSGAANTRFMRIPNKRYSGPFELHYLNSAACAAMCARNALCGSVSYRENDNTCWLTSGDLCAVGDGSNFLNDIQWDVFAAVGEFALGK